MGRRRFAAVLLVPPPQAAEVDVLRRALGVVDLDRIAPHVTLVPPVNVADDDVDHALEVMAAAATATAGPLRATIGPAATFWPSNPVVFLQVGDEAAVDAMRDLRGRLFQPPLSRPEGRPFVPHVTLRGRMAETLLPAAADALSGYREDVVFGGVALLEQVPEDHRRVWRTVHQVALGPAAVVGRGGVELRLEEVAGLPLDVQTFLRREAADAPRSRLAEGDWAPASPPAVVVARAPGEGRGDTDRVVGVLAGWFVGGTAVVDDLVVAAGRRGEGIGRHLLARFEHIAGEAGAVTFAASLPDDPAAVALFRGAGWEVGGVLPAAGGAVHRAAARRRA